MPEDVLKPEDIQMPDGNLFMACERVDRSAFGALPRGVELRCCRHDELDLWKAMHFDLPETAREYKPYMDEYFERVYAPQGELFFERCRFACVDGVPVGTCFVWKAYGRVNTVHWFKVLRAYEGRGIGRALLTDVLGALEDQDMPVCLHTQPSSYRAIKLYTDFGFRFVTDPAVGARTNDLERALPALRRVMPAAAFETLGFTRAPQALLDAAAGEQFSEF